MNDPISPGLSEKEYRQWLVSMRSTLNSRRMGFSYQELKMLFGASGKAAPSPLDDIAAVALAEYRALKAAAADTRWENIHFPNAIRATIHSKSIPVLGLRLYPEYKTASRLLPYHGIAVMRKEESNGREYMEIRQEITVVGNPGYTRVTGVDGVTQFYEAREDIKE